MLSPLIMSIIAEIEYRATFFSLFLFKILTANLRTKYAYRTFLSNRAYYYNSGITVIYAKLYYTFRIYKHIPLWESDCVQGIIYYTIQYSIPTILHPFTSNHLNPGKNSSLYYIVTLVLMIHFSKKLFLILYRAVTKFFLIIYRVWIHKNSLLKFFIIPPNDFCISYSIIDIL